MYITQQVQQIANNLTIINKLKEAFIFLNLKKGKLIRVSKKTDTIFDVTEDKEQIIMYFYDKEGGVLPFALTFLNNNVYFNYFDKPNDKFGSIIVKKDGCAFYNNENEKNDSSSIDDVPLVLDDDEGVESFKAAEKWLIENNRLIII